MKWCFPWLLLLCLTTSTACQKKEPVLVVENDGRNAADKNIASDDAAAVASQKNTVTHRPEDLPIGEMDRDTIVPPTFPRPIARLPYVIPGGGGSGGSRRTHGGGGDVAKEGDMRLMNGDTVSTVMGAGRLEFFHDGKWGSVCNINFEESAAAVACKKLGFSSGLPIGHALFVGYSMSSGPIQIANIDCNGSEESLTECSFGHNGDGQFGANNCEHFQDVALMCSSNLSMMANESVLMSTSQLTEVCQTFLGNNSSGCLVVNNGNDCGGGEYCKEISVNAVNGCCVTSNAQVCEKAAIANFGPCSTADLTFPLNCGIGRNCVNMDIGDFGCCTDVDDTCSVALNEPGSQFCMPLVDTCPGDLNCLAKFGPLGGCCTTAEGACAQVTGSNSTITCDASEMTSTCGDGTACYDIGTAQDCCLNEDEYCKFANGGMALQEIGVGPLNAISGTIDAISADNFNSQADVDCQSLNAPDKAYRFTVPSDGVFSFALSSTNFQNSLKIFFNGCTDGSEICTMSLPAGMGYESFAVYPLTAGQVVYIVVDSETSSSSGEFTLTVDN